MTHLLPARRYRWFQHTALSLIASIGVLIAISASIVSARPLTIEDVLDIQSVDRATISTASHEIAISMPRPARAGEVYGRNAYNVDPSRNDIWLVQRDGADLTQLTFGQENAAGYWCPHWSPDAQRLAMLSTAPEGDEPRGGDSARLYVWDRAQGALGRLSDRAMMTQVRYGSPLNELDIRAAGSQSSLTCMRGNENAPFVWLDETRLLAVLMPEGQRSAVVDRYAKFHSEAARSGREIRAGEVATVSRSDSGVAVDRSETSPYKAELVIFDLAADTQTSLGFVPAFPMFGALTIAVSPDNRRAAILAPRRAIEPHLGLKIQQNFGTWAVEKSLFLADLVGGGGIAEVALSDGADYPIDILSWSPGSRRVALRAHSEPSQARAQLWSLDSEKLALTALEPGLDVGGLSPSQHRTARYAVWLDDDQLLVRPSSNPSDKGSASSWRLIDTSSGRSEPFEGRGFDADELIRLRDGVIIWRAPEGPLKFDQETARFRPWKRIPVDQCDEPGELIRGWEDGAMKHALWTPEGPLNSSVTLTANAQILDHDCTGVVFVENSFSGSFIRFAAWDSENEPALLVARNTQLGTVDWGERAMIDYTHADGSAQKMAVIYPPDYDPKNRYPTLFWLYGGYGPSSIDNFYFDPHIFLPYNLQLYAEAGYLVVFPSVPIPSSDAPSEPFAAIPGGVLPALDELVRLGLTDENRVGVFGQSYGGYTVNALIAQTDRFAAAASLAGASELATNHAAFDPAARGWPGIDQDMAANQGIYETVIGLKRDPGADPDLYHRNSPLTYVDKIKTPLLLIHGELDTRAPLTQPEALYTLLRRRGRTARLLRYWGESHSLANSPANAADMTREIIAWFDRFVKNAEALPDTTAMQQEAD